MLTLLTCKQIFDGFGVGRGFGWLNGSTKSSNTNLLIDEVDTIQQKYGEIDQNSRGSFKIMSAANLEDEDDFYMKCINEVKQFLELIKDSPSYKIIEHSSATLSLYSNEEECKDSGPDHKEKEDDKIPIIINNGETKSKDMEPNNKDKDVGPSTKKNPDIDDNHLHGEELERTLAMKKKLKQKWGGQLNQEFQTTPELESRFFNHLNEHKTIESNNEFFLIFPSSNTIEFLNRQIIQIVDTIIIANLSRVATVLRCISTHVSHSLMEVDVDHDKPPHHLATIFQSSTATVHANNK
ncbi:hypothetical protein LXL04_031940 [Taraxacum kok-saghyz]